jgi:ATP-dependent helicase HrpA
MTAYPGLEPGEKGVNIRLFKTQAEAFAAHVRGVAALLEAKLSKDVEFLKRYLTVFEEYEKPALFFGGRAALEKGMLENIKREVFQKNIRSREEFEAYAETAMRALFEKSHALREAVFAIIEAYQRVRRTLREMEGAAGPGRALAALCQEAKEDLESIVPGKFLEVYSLDRLAHLPRYLNALQLRLERGKVDPGKDRKKIDQVRPFTDVLLRLREDMIAETLKEKRLAVEEFRWMVEEFKVSLFAPEVKTAFPISPKRLAVKLKEIEGLE